jgi:ubiquitin C-terminal hydrolase
MTVIGLQNIGNTCYLNSVCQVFLNCTHFIDLFMRINTENELLLLLKKFIYDYRTSGESISPTNMKKVIDKYNQFKGFHQHDADEFLIHLLDLIDIELKKENIDIVSSFFDHKYYTKISNKDNEKIIKFGERILQLPVSNNLNDSYIKYTSIDTFDWEIKNGTPKVPAEKKNVVYQWPIYLTVMFKKYTNNISKIDDDIDIPVIWKILNVNNNHKELITYQLVGGVIHLSIGGNIHSGHYICVIYRDNKFYICNDAQIYEVDFDKANQLLKKAYIVIYVKQ